MSAVLLGGPKKKDPKFLENYPCGRARAPQLGAKTHHALTGLVASTIASGRAPSLWDEVHLGFRIVVWSSGAGLRLKVQVRCRKWQKV